MNILVTGGLGFIGSALIRSLLDDKNNQILNIDKCSYASMPEALEGKDTLPNYSFKKVDIIEAEKLNSIIKDFVPDKIFHLAAESHVDRSITGPQEFLNTNILGTFNILESIRKNLTNLSKDFIKHLT